MGDIPDGCPSGRSEELQLNFLGKGCAIRRKQDGRPIPEKLKAREKAGEA
jgi:hypothetical protein